jgi:signal transduction histidine kinase
VGLRLWGGGGVTRVLVIEDNRRHAELITEELEDRQVTADVVWAANAAEGFDSLRAAPADLILLDYRLPDIDGLEFMRRLRGSGDTTPILFVTTADSVDLAVQAMKLGAEDFIQKQEGYLDVLPLLVKEALERQRLRRDKARLESELRQAEKLASLGILASGLAHNINNRLTSLKTFLDLLPYRLDDPSFSGEFLGTCREDLEKIVVLVQELTRYAFSEQVAQPPEPLSELVLRAIGHLDDEIARKQLVVTTEFEELPRIAVDAEGMKQLLLNLVKNAVQANPIGGEIRISLRRQESPRLEAVIRVEDRGIGLPAELRERIFDPFFTTKPHGLGIGLYICHKIATLHDGSIRVEDRPGGGASFVVRLPIEPRRPSGERGEIPAEG